MSLSIYGMVRDSIYGLRYLADIEEHKTAYEYLTKNGFLPINMNGHLVTYDLQNVLYLQTYEVLKKKVDGMEEVMTWKDLSREQIDFFIQNNPEQRIYIEEQGLDEELTPVVVRNGKIIAVVYFSQIGENRMASTYEYIARGMNPGVAVPLMLAKAFSLGTQQFGENGRIIFLLSQSILYSGCIKTFGMPSSELLVNEYFTICHSNAEIASAQRIAKRWAQRQQPKGMEDPLFKAFLENSIGFERTDVTVGRGKYLGDLTKMPEDQLKSYKKGLIDQFTQWGYNADQEVNRILRLTGQEKETTFMKLHPLRSSECSNLYQAYLKTGEVPELDIKVYDLSQITFFHADNTYESITDILPDHIRAEYTQRDYFWICALDPDRNLIGYTIMAWSDPFARTAILTDIWMLPAYQETELKRELISQSMNTARMNGSDYFYIRQAEGEPAITHLVPAAEEKGKLLLYEIGSIYRNFALVESIRVKTLDNIRDTLVEQAAQLGRDGEVIFYTRSYDRETQTFVGYHNELMATICAKRMGNDLVIFDYWISEQNRDDKILEKMMTALIRKAEEITGSRLRILIRAKDEEMAKRYQDFLKSENEMLTYTELLYDLEPLDEELLFSELMENVPEDVILRNAFAEKLRKYQSLQEHDLDLGMNEVLLLNSIQGLLGREIIERIRHY